MIWPKIYHNFKVLKIEKSIYLILHSLEFWDIFVFRTKDRQYLLLSNYSVVGIYEANLSH